MQQCAVQNQQQQVSVAAGQLANMPPGHLGNVTNTSVQPSMNWYGQALNEGGNNNPSPSHHVQMVTEQYPTPPSHHSHIGADATPQHVAQTYPPTDYLTPSPDSPNQSPGQWSSSSPHSAQSDWSEGVHSPTQPVGGVLPANQQPNQVHPNKTGGKRQDGVYL